MKSRLLTSAALTGALIGMLMLSTPSAGAESATTSQVFWVSKNPVSGSHASCTHPGFNTIQSAINAATATNVTIKVCPGTYAEQLTVAKNISIIGAGAPQPIVTYPATPVASTCNPNPTAGVNDFDVLDVCSHTLTLNSMTIAGPYGTNDCTIDDFGIAVVGGGTLKATGDVVRNIRQNPLNGCQGGVGILVGRQSTNNVGHATLLRVNVVNYQKVGLEVSNGHSTATVTNTNIQGPGETNQIASNGVEVIDGGLLTMSGGAVSGNECDVATVCGPNPETQTQSGGYLLIDPAVHTQITGTQISNNDIGIYNFVGPDPFANPPYPSTGAVPQIGEVALNNNRDEGILFDSGKAVVQQSLVSGGQYGVAIYTYAGQTPAPAGTVFASDITGATTAGVVALNDGGADPFAPILNVNNNTITGNAYGVLNNDFPGIINARRDWWGDGTGPSDWSFGAGNAVSANVNFFPWATASNGSSLAACTQTGSNITDNAASGNVVLCGTTGNDTITESGAANVLIVGNGGADTETGGTGNVYLIGNPGNDTLNAGTAASSSIQGRGGTNVCTPSVSNAREDHC